MAMTKKQNELLCRVDNEAPMGSALRNNFWVPALLSQTLVPDGPPELVRLFGEDFVAFRSTDGRVGFFDELCPHRGASLLLARNEDNGLRCIFHGWKYDVSGKTVEAPTEPRNPEAFCASVPLRHHPVREAAGVVWVWLGEGQPQKFPAFEFTTLPAPQVYAAKQVINCNWVQDVEGGMDSAHVSILHKAWLDASGLSAGGDDLAPIYEFEDCPGGFRYAATRKMRTGEKYVRVNQFVLPWYCFICPAQSNDGDRLVIMSTPVDDEHVIHWSIRYNPFRPIGPSNQNPAEDPNNFPPAPVGGKENRWGQDRGAMMRGHFSGFGHLNTEDFAVAVSQGAIADRTKEYLNAGDRSVVRVRQLILGLVEGAEDAQPAPAYSHDEIAYETVRAEVFITRDGTEWRKVA